MRREQWEPVVLEQLRQQAKVKTLMPLTQQQVQRLAKEMDLDY